MDRAALIAAMQVTAAPRPIPVSVEGWGTVHVRKPTVAEVEEASDAPEPADGKKRTFARAAARVICDAQGVRVFDPASDADVDLLSSQPWELLNQVLTAGGARGADPSGN